MANAMVQPQIHIPEREISGLRSLTREIVQETGRTTQGVVDQAAHMFLQTAAKHSPMSKKRRPVSANPDREVDPNDRRRKIGPRYRFKVHTQSREFYVLTDNRMDPRRRINYRGALQNTWRAMHGRVGKRKQVPLQGPAAHRTGRYLSAISTHQKRDEVRPSVRLINRLSYLFDVTPGIGELAMRNTQIRLEKTLEDYRRRNLEKMWKDKVIS